MNEPDERTRFGHLDTDEAYVGEAHTKHDFDKMMLSGCVTFALSSVAIFAAVAIPITLQQPLKSNADLIRCVGFGSMLALVIGGFSTYRYGLCGLCGSIAGLVPSAVFVWLRLKGAVDLPKLEDMTPPEFTGTAAWTVPIVGLVPLALVWYGIYALRRRVERLTLPRT